MLCSCIAILPMRVTESSSVSVVSDLVAASRKLTTLSRRVSVPADFTSRTSAAMKVCCLRIREMSFCCASSPT